MELSCLLMGVRLLANKSSSKVFKNSFIAGNSIEDSFT
jgi:hypothetical protein